MNNPLHAFSLSFPTNTIWFLYHSMPLIVASNE